MIFNADMDRTLIYSKDFIKDISPDLIECVEVLDKKPISYMTKEAISYLTEMAKEPSIRFIPTTTRRKEQFQRVKYFQDFAYAIVANGGVILKNGKVLGEWEQMLSYAKKPFLKKMDELCGKLSRQSFIIREPMISDGSYLYTRTNDAKACRKFLEQELDAKDWKWYIEREKVYIMPWIIDKRFAISFLKQKLGENIVVAAGDSLLDRGALLYADYGYIPKHASLIEHEPIDLYPSISIVPEKGILAGEAILEKVIEKKGR